MSVNLEQLQAQLALYEQTKANHQKALDQLLVLVEQRKGNISACNGAIEACQELIAQIEGATKPGDSQPAAKPAVKKKSGKGGSKKAAA